MPEVELMAEMVPSKHQACPRHRPVEKIGAQHRSQAPPLEVLDLDILAKLQLLTRGVQPITEFDVLDRWPGEKLVEPARLEEIVRANRPARAPERHGILAAMLMDVKMEQIAEKRDGVSCGRLIIVGADQAADFTVSQDSCDIADQARANFDIRVDEKQDRAGGRSRAGIPRYRRGPRGEGESIWINLTPISSITSATPGA